MTTPLNVVGAPKNISSGVQKPKTIADGLTDVLADTYRLTFKSHAFHWNVEGPLFYSIHSLTEEHYENMFAAADKLAERIRAIGQMAPMSMHQMMSASVINDPETTPSAGEMCTMLADDHQRIAHRLHALIEIAGEQNDPVTEDLATERSAFHEQAAWMLRALATE
ncbi:DNA protection during starvation protein 1 [Roseobacter fucihabitans]|uniref:DNA protection during starvation protein 1 n=1 Tax=Roseobacter fucihabitans TaxID=1537242 RepID=A0ABZ2C1I6_9RHOB|nr:DNA starvation/stationary phase protection protein [Roseobacter litoralis]MBC6963951.1 DNA protection during starvation protein 1 [Roseobacter litoralis]MBC6963964.1 DNA protection during starvation protein 1 [Roseobacter litoralis]